MYRKAFAATLAAFFFGSPAWALNKCTDSAGHVTYQVDACPRSEKATNIKIWGEGKAMPYVPPKKLPVVTPDANIQSPPEAKPLLALYSRWIDIDTLARSTARIALAGPVGKMQDLLREAQAAQVVDCAQDAKKSLVSLISDDTDAMIAFMQKDELATQIYDIALRGNQIKAFELQARMMLCTTP
ncbi:exported hypothetical protein [Thiomonas sp. CB3]|nr:exported hypothetical protein [Thiomonas sp. CB3]